jgi:hypothetical protein
MKERASSLGGAEDSYSGPVRFDVSWQERRERKKASVEAESADEAVRKLARELDHSPGIAYEVEPEDDIGYMERITLS